MPLSVNFWPFSSCGMRTYYTPACPTDENGEEARGTNQLIARNTMVTRRLAAVLLLLAVCLIAVVTAIPKAGNSTMASSTPAWFDDLWNLPADGQCLWVSRGC